MNGPPPRDVPDRVERAADRLESLLPGRVRREVPFAELTTYRLGGPAAVLVKVGTAPEVAALARGIPPGVPVLVVGRGSNLVVADEGFAGVAVVLDGELAEFRVEDATVRAGGGLALPVLARRSAGAGLAGLEFFVGIPGSVGGAVRMNAGGHGRETVEVLRRVWLADLAAEGEVEERAVGDLGLGYRRSLVLPSQVVLAAEFRVGSDDAAACEARIDEVVRWRRANQPGGSNAGSVFTNPPGDSAGRLIDACGLKGLTVGGVRVSERHANFFQAEPGARAGDVVSLVAEVARRVEEETGVRLVPELRRIGFAGEPGARPGAPPAWPGEGHAWSGDRPDSLGTPRAPGGAAA
ncbi:MAG: UDP-N-acetylmuramate dehydrogenase [Actinomycetota bacterium]|nr:UDP-N-acetylmuramate dehydrogenase [Actinomycetota bacterium]